MSPDSWTIILSAVAAIASFGTFCYTVCTTRKSAKYKQSTLINCWVVQQSPSETKIIISNSSSEPIFNIFIYLVSNNDFKSIIGANNKLNIPPAHLYKWLEVLPPGKREIILGSRGPAMGNEHDVVGMFFRDAKNIEWSRLANGKLSPFKYEDNLERSAITLKHV